jgi:hypothetical protein
MPHDLEYVVKDALMMCDKGALPAPFTPTSNTHVKINGCLVTTKADKAPMTNIPSFGACSVKNGSPCTPAPIAWTDTYKVKVKGQETILFKSKMPCGTGGKIEFITSGQVPIPPEEYDKLMEEHGEDDDSGWGWWDTAELIPVVGNIIGMVREGAKGNWGMVALNAGFLVLDIVTLGTASVGTAAAKGAIKGGLKVAAKKTAQKALSTAAKLGTKQGMKQVGKGFAKAAAKKVDDFVIKHAKVCVFACFTAGTKVAVKDGHKNIEDIRQGDYVWAYNEATGQSDLKPVVTIMEKDIDATIALTLGNEVIETTAEHPFYTQSGWKAAADLTLEDQVKTKSGNWQRIEATNFLYTKKKVYNFEVADWHTYFVGTWEWLVHNIACFKGSLKTISKRLMYLGKTPGKASRTGREVFERMMKEVPPTAKVLPNGKKMFKEASDGKWYDIAKADMGHINDAVTWWNKTGRKYGAKSKEVRKWMLDSKNYMYEYYKVNRSKGAILGKATTYKPPLK